MKTAAELAEYHAALRQRYDDRDERFSSMSDMLNQEWELLDANGESIQVATPNMILAAIEDIAEAASLLPSVRVRPNKGTATPKAQANTMEMAGAAYFDHNQIELLIPQWFMDLLAFGLSPAIVWPDFDARQPMILKRDPRTFYPEATLRPGSVLHRAMFARTVHYTQLPPEHQALLIPHGVSAFPDRANVVLLEYLDGEEITTAALVAGQGYRSSTDLYRYYVDNYVPVILDQIENRLGVCPVVAHSRITWDGEFRGQFDHVQETQKAHARIMAMDIDYAAQAVYSDIWGRDIIGEIGIGGGSYIEVGPNGAIGRVPPASSSIDLWRSIEKLEDQLHMGGRWPKSRPGQVDQSIASGKFVEATMGPMSTAIKTLHQIMGRGLETVLRLCYATDQVYFPGKKVITGRRRNSEFIHEYDPATDIDLSHKIVAEYGLGLGRDVGESAVLALQYAEKELISEEWVQENIEGLTDVIRERRRVDLQRIEKMMFARLLQAVEQGEMPPSHLAQIYEDREKGKALVDIFKEHFPEEPVPPALEEGGEDELAALAAAAGGGGGGIAPPGGPPAGALPPPPPDAQRLLNQMNVPVAPNMMLGAQVQR